MKKTGPNAIGCNEPFKFKTTELHCSLDKGHNGQHRAELDRPGGEVFLEWPHGWTLAAAKARI